MPLPKNILCSMLGVVFYFRKETNINSKTLHKHSAEEIINDEDLASASERGHCWKQQLKEEIIWLVIYCGIQADWDRQRVVAVEEDQSKNIQWNKEEKNI